MTFSQYNEQEIILDFFKDVPRGTLLDIGAYHAEVFSNSRALINKGWSGMLVEASPRCFSNLMRYYKGVPNITLLNAFVSDSWGFTKFYDSEGAVATGVQENYDQWKEAQKDFQEIYVPTIEAYRLNEIIEKVDFVTIDCEGSDLKIVKNMNWATHQPSLICVEYGKDAIEIGNHLAVFGYSVHHVNQANLFFKK